MNSRGDLAHGVGDCRRFGVISPTRRRRLPLAGVLSAYVVSVTCLAISAIAIPWLVLSTTGSAASTGLVVFAELFPYVLMQAIAGPWVEKIGPRRASWLANLVAGLALLVVPALYLAEVLGYAALVIVVAAVGALRGIADCGSAPLIPGTARLADTPLERAAGLHASATQAGHLIGAPIAAVLLTFAVPPIVLAVSAAGFLLAALLVGLLVPSDIGAPTSDEANPEAYWRRLRTGLAFLAQEPVLRAVVLMVLTVNLLNAGFISVLLPSWVQEHDYPVAAVGTVATAYALGGLAGSLFGAWIAPRANRWVLYSFGFLLGASPLPLGLALTQAVPPMFVVALCAGLAFGGINPVIGAVQYERIPASQLPRVLGAAKATMWLGLPLGPVVAGVLVDGAGLSIALFVIGGAALLTTLLPFALRVFRDVNQRPAPTHRQ